MFLGFASVFCNQLFNAAENKKKSIASKGYEKFILASENLFQLAPKIKTKYNRFYENSFYDNLLYQKKQFISYAPQSH